MDGCSPPELEKNSQEVGDRGPGHGHLAPAAARGGPSGKAIVVTSSPLPAAPKAVAEKLMLRQELWPLASDFAGLARQFTDEMRRVSSNLLTELDAAR